MYSSPLRGSIYILIDACLRVIDTPQPQGWGFLIQRLTFKCCVLTAILKPFNRRNPTN